MKRIFITLLFVSILLLGGGVTYGQSESLPFDQVTKMANDYYLAAINSYAEKIERDWVSRRLRSGEYEMPFDYYVNGQNDGNGYPLYISMHGGGGTEATVNDQQWENQKGLYGVVDGVYFVPRSPTDTWNMWHQGYMEDFLTQIITYSLARLDVNPNRIYLLGYSAGGDGVYNLATRLSDRFAAAAMMAGHPGDARIENLRNLPFAIYVGENDTAYNRSSLAVEWLRAFQRLSQEDQAGYDYRVSIFEGKGHWMDGLDGEAIGWLAGYQRLSCPNCVVWIQDDVLNTHKNNLEVRNPKQGDTLREMIDYENNTVYLYSEEYDEVTVWLDDYIVNLDKPVKILFNDKKVFEGMVARTEQNIIESLNARLDPEFVYWGRVVVSK